MDAALERARALRLMAFDVDGVLTDGALYLTDRGEEMKRFHSLDGLGTKLLAGTGVELAIITGRTSRLVAARAAELGISIVYQGVERQARRPRSLRARLGLALDACGYMGDDLPDLPLLVRCGFAATVPDAPEAIRARAHYVSSAARGARRRAGSVRGDPRGAGRARRRDRQVPRSESPYQYALLARARRGSRGADSWLERAVQAPAGSAPNALEHDPDFVVERFTATNLDKAGRPDSEAHRDAAWSTTPTTRRPSSRSRGWRSSRAEGPPVQDLAPSAAP